MQLTTEQTERFYGIWWPLLKFVNKRLRLFPDILKSPKQSKVPIEAAVEIREALWEDDSLLEAFIEENPAELPAEDLELAASWKHRLSGTFFVMRHLKKYSVFLDEDDTPRAYGVLGLVSPVEEVIGPYLPVMVKAVLLPFEDKIIYDSLLAPYSVTFGGNITASLNRSYRDAQERGNIVTSLRPSDDSLEPKNFQKSVKERNAKILREFRKELYKIGLSLKMVEHHASNIEALNDSLIEHDPPRLLLDINVNLVEEYFAGLRDVDKKALATSFKRFARFLYDSLRIVPETFDDVSEALKLYEPKRGKRPPRRKSSQLSDKE